MKRKKNDPIIIAKNNSEKIDQEKMTFFRGEKVIRFKARLSLIVIWVAASVICLFFALLSFSTKPLPSYISNTLFLDKLQLDNGGLGADTNEAFVFVNMDKHFFLTHFPAGTGEKVEPAEQNPIEPAHVDVKDQIRVIRKIKAINKIKASTTDFDIKPVPQ